MSDADARRGDQIFVADPAQPARRGAVARQSHRDDGRTVFMQRLADGAEAVG